MTKFGRYPDHDAVDLAPMARSPPSRTAASRSTTWMCSPPERCFRRRRAWPSRCRSRSADGYSAYTARTPVRLRDGAAHRDAVDQGRRSREGFAVGVGRWGRWGYRWSGSRRRPGLCAVGRYGAVIEPTGTSAWPACPVAAQAGRYAYENDGVGFEQFAKVAYKNHPHSTLNPLAQYQKEFSLTRSWARP